MVFIATLAAELASEVRRVGDDNADMIILPECHPSPLPLESGTARVCAAVVGTRFGFRCSEFSNYLLNWTKFLCRFRTSRTKMLSVGFDK
jgi:hypothetical protein